MADLRLADVHRAATAYANRPRMIAADILGVATVCLVAFCGAGLALSLGALAAAEVIAIVGARLFLAPEPPFRWVLFTLGHGITWRRSCEMWTATLPHSGHLKLKLAPVEASDGVTVVGHAFLEDGYCWTVRAVEPVSDAQLIACTEGSWPGKRDRRRPKVTLVLPAPLLQW